MNTREFAMSIRWGGVISQTNEGIDYEGGEVKNLKIKKVVSYKQVLKKLRWMLNLGEDQELTSITYRSPVLDENQVSHYTPVLITNDMSLMTMYRMVLLLPWYNYAELYVEYGHKSFIELLEEGSIDSSVPSMSASYFTHDFEESSAARHSPSSEEDSMENYEPGSDWDNNGSESESHSVYIPPEFFSKLPEGIGNLMSGRNHCPDVPDDYNWDEMRDLYPGISFNSKSETSNALKAHVIKRQFQSFMSKSNKTQVVMRCVEYKSMGCPWKVSVTDRDDGKGWVVRKATSTHTCMPGSRSRDHKQLSSELIANCIDHLIMSQPNIRIKTVIAECAKNHLVTPKYKKAWYGKQRAIDKVYGNWEESYNKLQHLMLTLSDRNPGFCYEWDRIDVDGHPDYRIFQRVFWAFQPCIEGFKHCLPVISVDGTFLTGKYKGTLLMACGQDGNRNLLPIAFAVVESENTRSWPWFFDCLQRYVTQREGLCIISDRHQGIQNAMANINLRWKWRWCLRHYMSNYNTHVKNKEMKKKIWPIGVQNQLRKHAILVEKFASVDARLGLGSADWVTENQIHWSLAHDNDDGGSRFSIMTTNLSECMNGVLKEVRDMPMEALVLQTFYRVNEYFNDRRKDAESCFEAGSVFTKYCADEFNRRSQKANRHHVRPFDSVGAKFEVTTGRTNNVNKGGHSQVVQLDVDGRCGRCTCGKFQGTAIPCSHAIACCQFLDMDGKVFINPHYSIAGLRECYKYEFLPLGDRWYWPEYIGPSLLPDSAMRRKRGRPRKSRLRNEMDWRDGGIAPECSACDQAGHNARSCPNLSSSQSQPRSSRASGSRGR